MEYGRQYITKTTYVILCFIQHEGTLYLSMHSLVQSETVALLPRTVRGLIGNLLGNLLFYQGIAGDTAGVGGHVRQNLRQGASLELVSSS